MDSESLNPDPDTDPDPAFSSESGSGSFFIKICNLLMSKAKLQEKPSALKKEHPAALKNYVCGSLLPSWIRIANPDPDTDTGTLLNPDPIRIRIRIHNTALRNTMTAARKTLQAILRR